MRCYIFYFCLLIWNFILCEERFQRLFSQNPLSCTIPVVWSLLTQWARLKKMCWCFFQLEVNIVTFISRVFHHLIVLGLNVIKMILIYLLYKWLFDRYIQFFLRKGESVHIAADYFHLSASSLYCIKWIKVIY